MLRIQRAILLEILATFLVTLCLVTAVMFAGQSLQRMGRTQGLELRHLWTVLPSLVPVALSYALPYSFLLAVALTYGRMVADREVIALRIGGVPARAIVAPAVALGAVISVAGLWLTGWVVPAAVTSVRMQEKALVDVFLASLGSADRSVAFDTGRMSFASYDPESGAFLDFELDRRAKGGRLLEKVIGDRAFLRRSGDEIWLETDAYFLGEEPDGGGRAPPAWGLRRVNVGYVEALGASTAFNDYFGVSRFEKKPRDMTLPELAYAVSRGDSIAFEERRTVPELHARVAWAVAPFVFGLVAAAVALLVTPRGRRLLGFLVAFVSVLCVHLPLLFGGRSLAESGRVAPWLGVWCADAVLLAAGLVCLRKVAAR
jgi:lipopolysaccharide export system permease protein